MHASLRTSSFSLSIALPLFILTAGLMAAAGSTAAVGPVAAAQQAASAPPKADPPNASRASHAETPDVPAISEADLRHRLQGKSLYLRGGYSENNLRFDEQGRLVSTSPQQAYTLSMLDIQKVRVTKRKVQIEAIRYGIHFLGAGPAEDPFAASDKVRITPKKKLVRISINRASVIAPKKKKSKGGAEQPAADPDKSRVRTHAAANQLLDEALSNVFAEGLDARMMASLPDFWRLYFQAAASKSDWKPGDPAILRQRTVERKARLLTTFEPPSNDFAQAAGVAGMAMYHVVVGPDGKPAEIAVGRPIGFGLDENAVASIHKASFEPAMKDGKPVPVLLDLLVQFRIYSKRTAAAAATNAAGAVVSESESPSLPGPYTANQPATRQQ